MGELGGFELGFKGIRERREGVVGERERIRGCDIRNGLVCER